MKFSDIFVSRSKQLFWGALPLAHSGLSNNYGSIRPGESYFILRMKSMYLRDARKLWTKFYPMLHAFVQHDRTDEHAVAGPGQFKELGEAGLEHVINRNFRLIGPVPYTGDDVSLTVGLYSIPGGDAAEALINTVGTIAGLVGYGAVGAISGVVKQGVDSIVGLESAQLQIGVRDSFYINNPLRAGYWVGVATDQQHIKLQDLWFKDHVLAHGKSLAEAVPYNAHDYMVIEVEQRDTRDDWPTLPGIIEFDAQCTAILTNTVTSQVDKKARINALWLPFLESLRRSQLLTQFDRERIAAAVKESLTLRFKNQVTKPVRVLEGATTGVHPIEATAFGAVMRKHLLTITGDREAERRAMIAAMAVES